MTQFFVRARNVTTKTRSGQLFVGKRLSHTIAVRKNDGSFQPVVDVVFDTGAQHSVIPTKLAEKFGIPYSRDTALSLDVKGCAGKALGYKGQATLRFNELPGWEFDVLCLFVEGAERMLLGLPDQLRNFDFQSQPDNAHDSGGAGVLYRLRAEHAGRVVGQCQEQSSS